MSAETVTTKIEEKARLKAEEILSEARKEADEKASLVLREAEERKEKILDSAKREAELISKGIVQSAEQSAKLSELSARRKIMEKVRKNALSKLSSLDEKSLIKLYSGELSSSALTGEFSLIPAKADREKLKKNLPLLEKSAGVRIVLSESDADIKNGFILSSEVYDVNFSLEEIVNEKFSHYEKDIHDALFQVKEA